MKKLVYLLVIVAIISVSCFRVDKDIEQVSEASNSSFKLQKNVAPYSDIRTENINGVDYRVSRAPVGYYGGQIVTSTIGEGPKTFNPWVSKDATSSQVADMLYDSLLSTDPITGEVIPHLAKGYKVSDDKKTYTIKLREGVKWSDGKEITADDVVFTWNEIILAGFGNTSLRDSVLIDGEYPKVTKVDKYTVDFDIKKPFSPFLRLFGTQIAPKHVFESVVQKGKRYFDTYLGTTVNPQKIVSSGAFLLDEYVPAQRVVFKRNPNYYEIDAQKNKLPYVDKYVVLIVGDLNNEMLKFEAGELDAVSVRGKDLPRFKSKEKKSDFTVYNIGPTTSTMFIAFNLNSRTNKEGKYYVNPIKQKWFNNKNFRTAVDYAIDRKAMVNNVVNGVAQPLFTAESLSSIYLNEKLAVGHEQDVDYAKELLKDAGFYLDKDGFLYDEDGNPVEFDLYTNAGQTEREACGVMVKEDLRKLGIKVNFKPIEFNSLVSKMMSTCDWDMVLMGLTGNPLEPHTGLNVWNSKGHLHLFNMRFPYDKTLDILSWEKELDEIYTIAPLELDFEKRKPLYDRYQEIIYEERPIIYLYSPLTIMAVRDKIKNLYPTPLGGAMHNIEELYIEK